MILASVLSAVVVTAVIFLAAPAVVAKGVGVQKSADRERKLQRGSKVIAGFELIHAATGQVIATLVNGTVIDMSTLVPRMTVPSFSIRAVVSRGATALSSSNTVSIEFPVLNQSRSVIHVDSSPPYARCGRTGTKYVACSDLGVRRHSVSARLFPCPRASSTTAAAGAARQCRATSTHTVSFTIKRGGASKVPVKAPVKAPVKKPVKAPVKVPVKLPVKVPVQRPVTMTAPTPIVAYQTCRDTLVVHFGIISRAGHMLSLEGTTPEDLALQWLYYNDTTVPAMNKPSPSSLPCSDAQLFRLRQRFALLTLWFQQTTPATTGNAKTASAFWDWDAAWLKGDECDKDEATFDTTSVVSCASMDLGGSIGRQNVVTSIDITGRGLYGTLPPDLSQLSHMKYFLAPANNFRGTIPSSWASLTNLADLDLTHNALTGTLPTAALPKWTNLVEFFVTNNDLTGTLPTEMGLWTKLLRLYVGQNRLRGTLPTHIGNWKLLQFVDVSVNAFSGTLPTILKQWTNLMWLDASNNRLTGTLSGTSLMQWSAASGISNYFNVSHNRLSGSLPTELAAWKGMATFWVAHNQFSGTIPTQLATAWRGLRMASFVNNSLVSSGVDMPLCAVHNALANKVIYADCAVTCSCCLDRDQCN